MRVDTSQQLSGSLGARSTFIWSLSLRDSHTHMHRNSHIHTHTLSPQKVSSEKEKSVRLYLIYVTKWTSGFKVSESRLLFLPQEEQRVVTFFIFQNWKPYWITFHRIKNLSALRLTSWDIKNYLQHQSGRFLSFCLLVSNNFEVQTCRKSHCIWFAECLWFIHITSL